MIILIHSPVDEGVKYGSNERMTEENSDGREVEWVVEGKVPENPGACLVRKCCVSPSALVVQLVLLSQDEGRYSETEENAGHQAKESLLKESSLSA